MLFRSLILSLSLFSCIAAPISYAGDFEAGVEFIHNIEGDFADTCVDERYISRSRILDSGDKMTLTCHMTTSQGGSSDPGETLPNTGRPDPLLLMLLRPMDHVHASAVGTVTHPFGTDDRAIAHIAESVREMEDAEMRIKALDASIERLMNLRAMLEE